MNNVCHVSVDIMELIWNIFVFVTPISGDFSAKREEQTNLYRLQKNNFWIKGTLAI